MIFRRILIFLFLAHTIIPVAWSANTLEGSVQQKTKCIAQTNQRTSALVAQDWGELEQLAKQYLKACKYAFDEEDYSTAYEQIAISNIKLGNPKKALVASDSCISISYSNSGCHLQKIEALIQLKRLTDAKAALDKTERLIKHLIELNERELQDAPTALDKELFESRLNNLNAQQSHASAIRDGYFSQ